VPGLTFSEASSGQTYDRVKLPKITTVTSDNKQSVYIGMAYQDMNNTINPVKARFGTRSVEDPSYEELHESVIFIGTNITINTRHEGGNYVPYIYYYNASSNQTPNSIKVAWRTDMETLRDGARPDKTDGGAKDTFTGAWESMTIPTENIPIEATVCGGVPSTATGTNVYMNSTVFLGYMSDTGYEKAYIKK